MSKYHVLQRLPATGLSYHAYALHVDDLQAGTELALVRQPDNKHDKNAIALFLEDDQIGWIPQANNEVLARLMDLGVDLTCRVVAHDPRGPLSSRLYVVVFIGVAE